MTIREISWLPDLTDRHAAKYIAIADCLAEDIASGRLAVGTRLPTHRDLAWELQVTVGTVSRAYREAERRGLIAGEVGRGTYVQTPRSTTANGKPLLNDADIFVPDEEPLRDDPDQPINMVFNFPPPGIAHQEMRKTMARLTDDPVLAQCIGYQPHVGMERHRIVGSQWLAQRGIDVAPDDVLLTPGAHCGVLVSLSAITNPGDLVVTEALSYAGLKSIARTLGLRLDTLEIDEFGLLPDSFEAACREKKPAALSCVPTLHNPTNAIMPVERRQQIAEIARKYNVPIVEDDIFSMLLPDAPPPLYTFAPDLTFYVTSISKTLSPGLRVGYVTGPARHKTALSAAIRATSWMASPLTAEIASRWIMEGRAQDILESHKREAMARKFLFDERFGPIGASYKLPEGALHAWLQVPESMRAAEFVRAAEKRGVQLCPHDAFTIGRAPSPHAVRICLGPPREQETLARALNILKEIFLDEGAVNEVGYV